MQPLLKYLQMSTAPSSFSARNVDLKAKFSLTVSRLQKDLIRQRAR